MDSNPNVPLMAHPHNDFLYVAASFGAVGMVTTGFFNTQILDVGTAFIISFSFGLQSSFQNTGIMGSIEE